MNQTSQIFLEQIKLQVAEIERCMASTTGGAPDTALTDKALQASRDAFAKIENYLIGPPVVAANLLPGTC